MKTPLLFAMPLLLAALSAYAQDDGEQWSTSSLSEETIEKIQKANYDYKKCASDEMQKPDYRQRDSREATDAIVKTCESVLSTIRQVYLDQGVPEIVADRHLRQMRIRVMRNVLQEMMYLEAARAVDSK